MNPIERAAASSRWAQVNVGEKALFFLGLLLLTLILPPRGLLPIFVILIGAAAWIHVPPRLLTVLVAAPAAFIAVGVGPLIFSFGADGITYLGWENAVYVVIRSTVAMTATMLFALTTPLPEILGFLRLPRALSEVVSLMYRFIGSMAQTAVSMRQAQAQRLGRLSISSAGMQASSLFLITFLRARALQEGLELRGDPASLAVSTVKRPVRWGFVLATCACFVALWVLT
ncbi:energy-coupling factor transporter transmembrane component T family protein [Corynebacterium sp. H130]|uniref:energy-coupling factor transporter transmembrane component T family protein n=1 Tax=Corynebacterium sp. H130 TaxID=3133444 RepID=UPI0030A2B86C